MRIARSICFVIVVANSVAPMASAAELTKDPLPQVKKAVDDEKAVLVDVREKKEWDEGHIAGAIFLPLRGLQDGVTKEELKLLPKDKILYVHCVVGKRAVTAANILERNGYKVRPMKPGYKEMIAAGFSKAKE